ncbi:hypothetical protein O1611_g1604 [Lasiodiplodia mahajangana]|uniref:Uncharacterized protein n=1 Tax=Lasiodiplodia mahajangana TaxID=1108764 RepID=A0ACC2JXU0_9PEZI|nr:hypothetical protein O1611_g1604 [Lasiodiplodia mahajangana]
MLQPRANLPADLYQRAMLTIVSEYDLRMYAVNDSYLPPSRGMSEYGSLSAQPTNGLRDMAYGICPSQNQDSSPGLGSATSPLTGVLSQVGKQVPPAVNRAEESLHPGNKKNETQAQPQAGKPPPKSQKASDPLGGLGGLTSLLGGLVPI